MAKVNAVFLLLVLPFFLRLWIEAVVWRIERGPQMLGFSLIHGGAGTFTAPIVLSYLSMFLYWMFVAAVALMWLFPSVRKQMAGTKLIIFGGTSTFAFVVVAEYMQTELPVAVLYLGALALSALACLFLWLSFLSFREPENVVV